MENEVKSSNSLWWDIHTYQKNTEWIEENVKRVDQSVKEMLRLMEQDGDIYLEKVDTSNLNQPALVTHLKEISHMHHLLAERYGKLTGELHSHMQSATGVQNSDGTIFGSQQNSSLLTPEKNLGMQNVEGQVVSSDISLSSGGGISEVSSNAYSRSSSLSSDSDSESFYLTPNDRSSSVSSSKMLKHKIVNMETEPLVMEEVDVQTKHKHPYDPIKYGESEDYETLLRRISEYEEELNISSQKLQFAEEEIAKLRSELENNVAVFVKMDGLETELVSAKNQIKFHEAYIDTENQKSLLLQKEIVELEAKLESEKRQVLELQESIQKYMSELSDRDLEIQKLNAELQDASGNFGLEKWQLESCISKLSERLTFHEARTEELQMELESLAEEMKKCEADKEEMEKSQESMKIRLQNDIKCMKQELFTKNVLVGNLNKNLDGLKHEHDMLMAEKDTVSSELQTLHAEIRDRENQIQHLDYNLHELHSENERLSATSECANKQTIQLKSRIEELEKELGMQRVVISEREEEKREAIRQLSFSLDHFRSAYGELRSAYVGSKQPMARGLVDLAIRS